MNKIKKANRKTTSKAIQNGIKKMQKTAFVASTIATLMLTSATTAFAANAENSTPANVNSNTMNTMVGLVFWALRVLVLLIGGATGLYKFVNGQSNEDTRERNAGIVLVAAAGIAFGVSFAIQDLI